MKTMLVAAAAAVAALAVTGVSSAAPARHGAGPAAAQKPKLTLVLRSTAYGKVLFDGRGQVVYAFTRDKRGGPSRCYGDCAKAWPVYFAKGTVVRAGKGVKKSLIGTTRRRDGRRQYTYRGWPLYYYAHEGRFEVKCQNVDQYGGLWLVVRANGALVR